MVKDMKRHLIGILFFYIVPNLFSQQYTLDDSTRITSQEIVQKIRAGSSFAVVSIKSLSDDLTSHIIGLLETALVNTEKLQMISRQRVQDVLNEQDFGISGYVDDESAQKIGKILGAKYILTGDLVKPEKKYFLNVQILETETAIIMYSRSFEIKNSELRNYEQIIILKQRQEQLERERLIRDEKKRQKDAINELKAQERKENRDNLFDFADWTPVPPIHFQFGYS
jgi:TolB-like protein